MPTKQQRIPAKIGERFGRLVIMAPFTQWPERGWLCKRDCGKIRAVRQKFLRSGKTVSCGCLHKEVVSKTFTKHGLSKHPGYSVWGSMMDRCKNPKSPGYFRYGGRGISVCERWLSVENFIEDMGIPPKGKSLDRIDPNGNYSKENCR